MLPKREFDIGDEVRIVSGVLSEWLGPFAGMVARERVMVVLQLLGAHCRVKMRRDAIEPVS
jgi:hypothetical protein